MKKRKDVITRVLNEVKEHLCLDETQIRDFKSFVLNESQVDQHSIRTMRVKPHSIVPYYILKREHFTSCIIRIDEILKSLYSGTEVKEILEMEKAKVTGVFIDVINSDEQDPVRTLFFSSQELAYLPTRNVSPLAVFSKLFTEPIQKGLRENGILHGKCTKFESDEEYYKMIFDNALALNTYALVRKKISQEENKFIKEAILAIDLFRLSWVSSNKTAEFENLPSTISPTNEITVKDIDSAVKGLEKAGVISHDETDLLRRDLLNNEEYLKCKSCGEVFLKTRNTQEYCARCSNKAGYHSIRREIEGKTTWGGARDGAGRKKKDGE